MEAGIRFLPYRTESGRPEATGRRVIYRVVKLKVELQAITWAEGDDPAEGAGRSPFDPSPAPWPERPDAVLWGEPMLRMMDFIARQRAGKIILGAQGRRVWFNASPD